jgi:carbon monoxide dehydrogenase subunit G
MPVRVAESIRIDKPPAEVWKAIADYSFDLQWRKGLTDMTPDPPGGPAPGTKVHEVVKTSGREYVADTVVSDVDPGVSYRFAGAGTIGGLRGARRVEPEPNGAGAIFTYEIELEPQGGMRLLRPVLGRMVRSGLKKDLATLKGLLEATPEAAGLRE